MEVRTGLTRAEVEKLLGEWQGRLYGLALNVLGNVPDAEDALQEAALGIVRGAPDFRRGDPAAPWVYRIAANAAVSILRRRRGKEQAMSVEPAVKTSTGSAEAAEMRAAVRAAVGKLPSAERLSVVLHYFQGLDRREVAAVLEMPEGTVASHLARGRERLRERLSEFGAVLAALPLAEIDKAMAGAGSAEVPARLAEQLTRLVHGAPSGGSAGGAAAAKGGLLVKIGLGVAAAGLVAGATFWAVGGKSEESAKPPEKSSRFTTPVSDPGAEWARETFISRWSNGDPLDGPRPGIMYNAVPGAGIFEEGGSDYYFRKYEPGNDRYFTYAGDAAGWLDGPISRARINRSGYANERCAASSPDGRYLYFTEPQLDGALRVLDTVKGEIRTLAKDIGGSPGMTVDSKGNLYVVSQSGFQVVSPDGKAEKRALEYKEGTRGYALNLVIDEKKNRLYGARRDTYVWYWDLNNGGKVVDAFVAGSGPKREKCTSGPFEGSVFWCPAGLTRSPDDPEVRYLYFGGGDDNSFYQLDFEKKYVLRFREVKGRKGFFHLGESVKGDMGGGPIGSWCGPPGWGQDGDFYLGDWDMIGGIALYRYKRVK